MAAKTLSGVVAQVVSIAASSRGDMSQLAGLIARDPMLSARVLQAANSAAYASKRGVVTTIADAVRHIGCATVRNIAATLGIFDAMPSRGPDGFDPIRCWQHSFAVAQLCERLVALGNPDSDEAGVGYLAGLCHDLGEILFRTHFAKEYAMVLDVTQRSGRPREEVERVMLGMAHGELVMTILKCLSLPETILGPIGALHASAAARRNELPSPLARALRIAEAYANGLMLASSDASLLAPVAQSDCRAATRDPNPPRPDALMFRSDVLTLTAMLARLSAAEEATLLAPMYPRRDVRIWLARDPALSAFDPIEAALATLAEVDVHDALPGEMDLSDHRAVVAVARTNALRGFTAGEVHAAAARTRDGERLPCLLLVGRADPAPAAELAPTLWPLPIKDLAAFVQSIGAHDMSGHAQAVAA
jgi:HD-like signal output (HDOD) protein